MSWISNLFGLDEAPVGTGAIAVPTKPFHERSEEQLNILTKFVKQSSREVSPDVYSRLRSMDDLIRPLIKYIAANPVVIEKEIAIESLLTDYIPTPLGIYLQLPDSERTDGSAGDLVLISQYDTLERSIVELGKGIYKDSLAQLQTHAIFLETKFAN